MRVEFEGLKVERGEWSWRGVEGYYTRLTSERDNTYNITFTVLYCNPTTDPTVDDSIDYLIRVASSITYFKVNIVEAFILYYLTLPAIYLVVLFIATGGLARLLGGRERIPIRIV